jgi:hypothetical protein
MNTPQQHARAIAPRTSKPKRTDKDILADIRDVEAALSPENLTCDGESPAADVSRRRRKLKQRYNALLKELGREPTDAELWPELYP